MTTQRASPATRKPTLVVFLGNLGSLPVEQMVGGARRAEERAWLAVDELPRALGTQMDIDSPSDLAVLALTGEGGPRLRDSLRSLDLDLTRYRASLPLLTAREAQIVVAGRVGSH